MSKTQVKSLKYPLFPWVFTVPLLIVSFIIGVSFRGTDSMLFLPNLVGIIILGFLALWPGFKKGWSIPRFYLPGFVALYWLHILASISWSSVPYNSTLFALIFSLLPFIYLVFTIAPDRDKWVSIHVGALGAAMAGLAVWALIQFFFFLEEYGPRIKHPMLNPNNLAVLFNMSLFMALALYLQQRKRLYVVLSYALVILLFMALLATQSRGATLCLIIAIIPFIALVYKGSWVTWRKVIALAVGCVLFVYFMDSVSTINLSKNLPIIAMGDNSIVDRQLLWGSTWEMIKDNLWLGTGLGTFFYLYPKYRSPGDMSDGFFAHMDPLQFWAEMGAFSPFIFYVILMSVFVLTVKSVRASKPDSSNRLWLMASFCSLLVLLGHSHISFHLYMPAPLIMAGFILAFWQCNVDKILKVKPIFISVGDSKFLKYGGKAALIVVLSIAVFWLESAAAGVYFANKATPLMNAGKKEDGYNNIVLAERYSPENWYLAYSMHARYRISRLIELKKSGSLEERREVYFEALEYLKKAKLANPLHVNLWNNEAWLYSYAYPDIDPNGSEKAVSILKKSLIFNPLFVDARLRLAHLYNVQGDYRGALSVLEGGLGYPMPIGYSALNLYSEIAKYRTHFGDTDGANQALMQVEAFKKRYKSRF